MASLLSLLPLVEQLEQGIQNSSSSPATETIKFGLRKRHGELLDTLPTAPPHPSQDRESRASSDSPTPENTPRSAHENEEKEATKPNLPDRGGDASGNEEEQSDDDADVEQPPSQEEESDTDSGSDSDNDFAQDLLDALGLDRRSEAGQTLIQCLGMEQEDLNAWLAEKEKEIAASKALVALLKDAQAGMALELAMWKSRAAKLEIAIATAQKERIAKPEAL
ncbi:hypothetical protein C8R47DRAFT_708100 [Mycena vitilis]|nr:hypothetical protein C8R47DRAFT_708100 [Mycena vitilis]